MHHLRCSGIFQLSYTKFCTSLKIYNISIREIFPRARSYMDGSMTFFDKYKHVTIYVCIWKSFMHPFGPFDFVLEFNILPRIIRNLTFACIFNTDMTATCTKMYIVIEITPSLDWDLRNFPVARSCSLTQPKHILYTCTWHCKQSFAVNCTIMSHYYDITRSDAKNDKNHYYNCF